MSPDGQVRFVNFLTMVNNSQDVLSKYNDGASGNSDVADRDPGFFTKWAISWMYPTLWRCFRNRSDPNKMPKLWKSLSTEVCGERAALLWKDELESGDPSPWRLIMRFDRSTMYFSIFIVCIQGFILSIGRPLMLQIAQTTLVCEQNGQICELSSPVVVFILTLSVLLEGLCVTIGKHLFAEVVGGKWMSGLSYLIVHKTGRLRMGETCNAESLIGNDIIRASESLKLSCWFPSAITGIIGGLVMLGVIVGSSSLPGVAVMFGVLIVNILIAKCIAQPMESKQMKYMDLRMAKLNEIVHTSKG